VLVIVLEDGTSTAETVLLSERALAADWDRVEEDAAWAHLQRGR
jgi:Flp pilus assembly protein TadD